MMGLFLKIAALLAVATGTSASRNLCSHNPTEGYLFCSYINLSMPPPGYWPQITWLDMYINNIAELTTNSLSGFPALSKLDISNNKLTELDFEELTAMTDLSSLFFGSNQINTLISPPDGTTLKKLEHVVASSNKISQLDPNFFLFAPNLIYLHIDYNPLVVESGQPVLNHPNLERLYMGGKETTIKVADSILLSGLPNLRYFSISYANVTSVDGAFFNNKLLEDITLSGNSITQITSGAFPSQERIRRLLLNGNPLKRLDTAAVSKAMAAGGSLSIRNTPLACECGFEALQWWAASNDITLDARCDGQPECSFTRRR